MKEQFTISRQLILSVTERHLVMVTTYIRMKWGRISCYTIAKANYSPRSLRGSRCAHSYTIELTTSLQIMRPFFNT